MNSSRTVLLNLSQTGLSLGVWFLDQYCSISKTLHALMNSLWNSDPLSFSELRNEPPVRKKNLWRKSAALAELLVVYILAKAILETVSMAVSIYLFVPFQWMTMVSKAIKYPENGLVFNSVILFLF